MLARNLKIQIKNALEQLNQHVDQELWRTFIGEKLLEDNLDLQDRNLFWENIEQSIADYKDAKSFKKYIELITNIFFKESVRDKLTLLYKKQLLWQNGAKALYEALAYDWDQKNLKQFQEVQKNFENFTVIYFDLDYFKAYNDLFGHLGGDLLLKRIALLLLKFYGNNKDISVYRMGGEEFVLLAKNINDINLFISDLHQELENVLNLYLTELGQIYNLDFSKEEAYEFIHNQIENYILENRALEYDGIFINVDLKRIKEKIYFYQSLLSQLEDQHEIYKYELEIKHLESKIQQLSHLSQKANKEDLFLLAREQFQAIFSNYVYKDYVESKFPFYNFEKLRPSQLLKVIKFLKSFDENFYKNEHIDQIYEKLKIDSIGITMGVLHLLISEKDRYIVVDDNILAELDNFLYGKEDEYLKENIMELRNLFKKTDLNYNELFQSLAKILKREDYEEAVILINKRRVDKIVQVASALEEEQKHSERNGIYLKIEHLGEEDIELSYNRRQTDKIILDKYYDLQKKIEKIRKYYELQLSKYQNVPVNRWWHKLSQHAQEIENFQIDILTNLYERWLDAYRYRFFDSLLGIYNNQYLLDFEIYNIFYFRSLEKDFSLVVLDFDNLKAVNDAVSHYAGDIVLMQTVVDLNFAFYNWAKYHNLKEEYYPRILRASPGEEFIIIFPNASAELSKTVLDSITGKITERIKNWLIQGDFLDKINDYLLNKQGKMNASVATFTSTIMNIKDFYNDPNFSFDYLYKLLESQNEQNKEELGKGKNYLFKF